MESVRHMLENNKKIARWAGLADHSPSIGWIVRGEKFVWTPEADETAASSGNESQAQYEIGSITKTLTAFLLANGEREGLWNASDSLSEGIPELESSEFARQTTLRELATHTSGLPRLPQNAILSMKQGKANPYAGYLDEHLLEAVRAEQVKIKKKHQYSNYGFGLLGWILARRSGVALRNMLAQELFVPLGMNGSELYSRKQADTAPEAGRKTAAEAKAVGARESSRAQAPPEQGSPAGNPFELTDARKQRMLAQSGETAERLRADLSLVSGFAPGGKPTPHWDFTSAMAGAGAVRSTLPDMLTYLEAQLGQHPGGASLEPAFLDCQTEQASVAPSKGVGIGYAWMRSMRGDGTVTHWHNGATYGASSFAAFNRDLQSGFVILSNRGISLGGQLKQMIGLGELGTDRAAHLVAETLFKNE
ncbi:serine hydrolase domain-containing protein [Saccharibacillus sp. CPCC 101409]|uniref:serine hydrolase domain-containing protein n=1 Tax=Saccharibacillus sp. CPCC 101409 TaxID=3058041 RepID=UPI00267172DC|nr:serine hydrolase domain-containing protein [Saccharibacillus sp. CPCC 101409]MDO3409446.1 serine hydrolase domain-containing protein [Saccharibacillus sp. CPCC 101409]